MRLSHGLTFTGQFTHLTCFEEVRRREVVDESVAEMIGGLSV